MAKYMTNHLDGNNSFHQLSKVILNLDFGNNSTSKFTTQAIQGLKLHQAAKKSLPKSYSANNIRKFYLQLKDLNKPISESTAEYLLYLFKNQEMLAESVDLCNNYHTMVRGYASAEEA